MASIATARLAVRAPFTANTGKPGRQSRNAVIVNASAQDADRRSVLLGLSGAALLAPLAQPGAASAESQAVMKELVIPVENLTTFQKRDILDEFKRRATTELKKVLTGADAPACLRLVLNDAGTYDQATGTGGMDGSIVLPEELDRPENRDLKPLVEKLAQAKAAIDATNAERGQIPISWADTLVLAAKVATELSWRELKIARDGSEGGKKIADQFGNPIQLRLGRVDATEPAPAGRLPAADASVEEIRQYFLKLGAKPGQTTSNPFSAKPPFWERMQFVLYCAAQPDPAAAEAKLIAANPIYAEYKTKYDRSRSTVTRTDYEVDFGDYFNRLADLGATFQPNAYLCPLKTLVPAKF